MAYKASVRLTRLGLEARPVNTQRVNQDIPEQGNRWWEFYAIRYAMGSITGAVIFFTLCTNTPSLKPLLFNFNNVSWEVLLLLGLYGMTFCYIASAPILVLHAGRMFVGDNPGKGPDTLSPIKRKTWITVAIIALPVLTAYFTWNLANISTLAVVCVVLPASVIIVLQFYYAILTLRRPGDVYTFYKKLAGKRPNNSELTESYRHLREHGNAFGIVICEIVLAMVLYVGAAVMGQSYSSDSVITFFVSVLLLWTFPGALVWMSATLIEQKFTYENFP